MVLSNAGWRRGMAIDVPPEAVLLKERILPPGYVDQKKGGLLFQFSIYRFERRTRFMLGYFIGRNQREIEVVLTYAIKGRYLPLKSLWTVWKIPSCL